MYGGHDASRAAKTTVTVLHGCGVAAAVWFLAGGGPAAADWLGIGLPRAEPLRCGLLISLALIYFGRFVVTTHVTLKRGMAVSEAVTIGVWVIVIHATMAFAGGTNPASVGPWTWVGLALYLLGSVLNTASELQRLRWKRLPQHQGRLYTRGLFRLTRHPNYLGDVTLFTGFALVTGTVTAFAIPVIMAGMFVFVNIPMLDRYLAGRYGDEYERYAARTARLVPFVY